MDIITTEFCDWMSGRIPMFKKTTAIYPKLETQKYEWKYPFREGGIDKIDEITLQVSTMVDNELFFEKYIIKTDTDNSTEDDIEKHLKIRLIDKIEKNNYER